MTNEQKKKKNTNQLKCSCGMEHLWNFDPNRMLNDQRIRTCKCGKVHQLENEKTFADY